MKLVLIDRSAVGSTLTTDAGGRMSEGQITSRLTSDKGFGVVGPAGQAPDDGPQLHHRRSRRMDADPPNAGMLDKALLSCSRQTTASGSGRPVWQ